MVRVVGMERILKSEGKTSFFQKFKARWSRIPNLDPTAQERKA
jgi:hypothetical protein